MKTIFIDGQFDENAYSNIYNPNWIGYKKKVKLEKLMKNEDLPPDNETVEDGGGNYVAGSREEYNAYLNYEDVQKDLETAKELIKELLIIAQAVNDAYNKNIETDLGRTIQQAKSFLK